MSQLWRLRDLLGTRRERLESCLMSNPFRLGEAADFTTTTYDYMDRVMEVKTPDHAVVSTSLTPNTVTVTDQAGKTRK